MAQNVKTVCGVAIASVKTVQGVAIASVKSILGVDNTSSGSSYLVEEDFEGAGYEETGWTEPDDSGVDEDYATSPAPLAGSQSMRILASSTNVNAVKTLAADQSTLYVYFMLNCPTNPADGKVMFSILDASNNTLAYIAFGSGNRIYMGCGATDTGLLTDAVTQATTWHFWIRYTKGTGSNAIASVGFSSDTTEPTSGTKFGSLSNGTSTGDARKLKFGSHNVSTLDMIVDKVRASATAIGSSPP